MDKRTTILICIAVMILGFMAQFNRMDGLLRLLPSRSHDIDISNLDKPEAGNGRDEYLIIYDPLSVQSVLTRHNIVRMLAQQKKAVTIRKLNGEEISTDLDGGLAAAPEVDSEAAAIKHPYGNLQRYRGVLLVTGQLDAVKDWDRLHDYVVDGGNLAVLEHVPDNMPASGQQRLHDLGIDSVWGTSVVPGLQLDDDFILGGRGLAIADGNAYNNEAALVKLACDATVDISAVDGVPLLWHIALGTGQVFALNINERDDKTNLGIYSAIVSHMGSDTIFPVLAAQLFYIDDFPAPVPEGNFARIYDELHTTTAKFFREIWWPYMQQNAKKYNLKYTGLIIETYGNQVDPPFEESDKQARSYNPIVYGRELLSMGGELGLHGYNHQPLAPAGYNQAELDYVPWKSQSDMVASLKELWRYVKSMYPDYTFQTYVPPSDILSPEGREAVCQVFPEVRTFSSLYDGLAASRAYYQDFARADDGRYELPRLTSGYVPPASMKWDFVSAANYIGIFSHFVHPDELLYEESKDKSWAQMAQALRDWLADTAERFPWLKPMTASEGTEALADYLDSDYRIERLSGQMNIYITQRPSTRPLHFILRTAHEPDREASSGCNITAAGEYGPDIYLVTVTSDKAHIVWRDMADNNE